MTVVSRLSTLAMDRPLPNYEFFAGLSPSAPVLMKTELVIQGSATRGRKGKVGLKTYRAAAEFDDFKAYKP